MISGKSFRLIASRAVPSRHLHEPWSRTQCLDRRFHSSPHSMGYLSNTVTKLGGPSLLNTADVFPTDTTPRSSIDMKEHNLFQKFSDQWWKPAGEFKALRALNELRVPLVRDSYIAYCLNGFSTEQRSRASSPYPLEGAKILDVGCGGGFLSEPLARLGAKVTGIDMVEENIQNAKSHWNGTRRNKENLEYLCTTVEDLSVQRSGSYDVVVCSEVVEHVNNVDTFMESLTNLVRDGGVTVFTTINRTPAAFAAAIVGAEYLLRIIPRGTHHWNKFVKPEELSSILRKRDMDVRLQHGMFYNPVNNRWYWTAFNGVSYAMVAVKTREVVSEVAKSSLS